MQYLLITEHERKRITAPFAEVVGEMYRMNALGIPHLCIDHRGRNKKPIRCVEDWVRLRMLDTMAEQDAQGA